ncbi:MAG TPA: hypothetical protein VG448_06080 [Solirubrobacterales bacterium]|nr:hypothetical protein [Solirubrobacterales bacterium]
MRPGAGTAEARGIQLRGYRRVFRIERRLFRFDRWRIPYPHGIPLRGLGYFLALELATVALGRVPLLGALLALPSPMIVFLFGPAAAAFLLMQGRVDGRPPHHALASLLRFSLKPRCLAGLAACPRPGETVAPVAELAVAYDGRESFPVSGRIKGPARITFRYPASVRAEGAPPWLRDPRVRRARARRYRVRRRAGAAPMLHGKTIAVPRGREVVIE